MQGSPDVRGRRAAPTGRAAAPGATGETAAQTPGSDPAPDGRTIGDIVRRSDLSVPEIMAVWAERDGCDGDPGPAVPVEGDVSLVAYDCPDGVAVELYVVDGGGHHWPGAREDPAHAPLAEAIDELGEPSPVSANDLMWSFFARHPRR